MRTMNVYVDTRDDRQSKIRCNLGSRGKFQRSRALGIAHVWIVCRSIRSGRFGSCRIEVLIGPATSLARCEPGFSADGEEIFATGELPEAIVPQIIGAGIRQHPSGLSP